MISGPSFSLYTASSFLIQLLSHLTPRAGIVRSSRF